MYQQLDKIITSHLIPGENYIYGFADLTGLLDNKFKGFNYGISIGLRLENSIVDEIMEGPTMKYYLHYKKINEDLVQLTQNIAEDFKRHKIDALTISPTVSTHDLDTTYYRTLRTDLSHKMVATRAGLGWIGKTDLFISKKFGPRLRLTSILLKDAVVSKSKSIDRSRCGTCNICVEICPAKSANGKLWDISVEREEFYDPWKCRDQCAEFGRTKLSIDARVCGICVAACPKGQKKVRGN
jgi:epoxyqueuosine reductase